MGKRKMHEKVDGLGGRDLQKIRNAIRQIWHRSHPRRLAVKRATGPDGFPRCENKSCKDFGKPQPKVSVDHIVPVGDLLNGGIERMFVSAMGLQNLCKKCHDEKTRNDNAATKKAKVSKRVSKDTEDFF